MTDKLHEAIVRAAWERSVDEANKVSNRYDSHPDGDGTDFAIGAHDAAAAIRALADNRDEIKGIIEKAGKDRG